MRFSTLQEKNHGWIDLFHLHGSKARFAGLQASTSHLKTF